MGVLKQKFQIEKENKLTDLGLEKDSWEKEKCDQVKGEASDPVDLNIGGTHFLTTSRFTLTKVLYI